MAMVEAVVVDSLFDPQELTEHADTYWKLIQPRPPLTRPIKWYLTCCDFYFKPSANRERLLTLLSRCQRGLLSYETCTVAELKAFVVRRGSMIHDNATKNVIVRQLETEDDSSIFTRFQVLPPELRILIYTVHFESFPPLPEEILRIPPPITRTSRQTREKTLHLFYRTCKTIINMCGTDAPFLVIPRCFHRHDTMKRPSFMRNSWETRHLFSDSPIQHLGNIRKFQLTGVITTATHWFDLWWDVDLGNGRNGIRIAAIEAEADECEHYPDNFRVVRDKYEARIKTLLETIMAREGSEKLRRGDLELFRHIFEPMNEA